MAVAVLTVYERDDPPVAGGDATPLGTITELLEFSVRDVISTHGLNAVQLAVNRHDSSAALIENHPGRWVTVAFPAIQADPVMTVRLGPSHTVVLGESDVYEVVHVGGLGILSLGEDAMLLDSVHAPGQPCRGSCPTVPERWAWRAGLADPIAYGGIVVRAIEEGQEQPGEPLAPWSITFDRDDDSDGNPWPDITAEFQQPVGLSMIGLYRRIAEAGDVFLVERPDFTIDGYQQFGSASWAIDRTSSTFAADKVRIYAAPDDRESNVLTGLEQEGEDEPFTHVLVKGMGDVHAQVAATWYTSGPGRWASIEYRDSDDTDLLERVGAEWLRRQFARTVAREVEITPGDDPEHGRYLPWKHLQVGDLHTIDAGGIDEDARLVAMRVELVPGAHDATTDDAHRSLRVVLEYNEASGEDGEGFTDSLGGNGEPGNCCGPRPPTPTTPPGAGTPDTVLARWSFDADLEDDDDQGYVFGGTGVFWNSAAGGIATAGFGGGRITETSIPASAGTEYLITARIRNRWGLNLTDGVVLRLTFRDAGAVSLAAHVAAPAAVAENAWVNVSVQATAPTGTVTMDLNTGRGSSGTSGSIHHDIDDVVITLVGSGTPGDPSVPGDGNPDLLGGETGTHALVDHSHWVISESAPTLTDDEDQGYTDDPPTFWVHVDDADDTTEVLGLYVLRDATAGAAEWVQVGAQTGHTHETTASTVVDHGSMGSAETFTATDGADHEGTLDDDLTVTLDGATDGEAAFMTLVLTQDGTGGHSITLPGSVPNASDIEAAFDQTANAVNVLTVFSYDGGTTWFAFLAGGPGTPAVESLDDLTDVTLTSPTEGDILRHDGFGWVNYSGHFRPVTHDFGSGPELVWDGDDLVMEWFD